jgi:hypothetical protein
VDLDAKRAAVAFILQRTIEDLATPILESGPYRGYICGYRLSSLHKYMCELKRCSLWPLSEAFRKSSLSTISTRILSFQESNTGLESTIQPKRDCLCKVCQMRFKELLENARRTHLNSMTGLCLDCVKAGGSKTNKEGKSCRIAHSAAF